MNKAPTEQQKREAVQAWHVLVCYALARMGATPAGRHLEVAEPIAEEEGSWGDAVVWARGRWDRKALTAAKER